jgi:GDPmannose 4,6-dehydratase
MAAAKISLGLQEKLYLGNIDSKRDWGHAKDYVEGMWLMMQQETPEDYVLATGQTSSVREFCNLVFQNVGIELEWIGEGADEKGINKANGRTIIQIDKKYYRPTEVDILLGYATKAKRELNWSPKYDLLQLAEEMVKKDLAALTKQRV